MRVSSLRHLWRGAAGVTAVAGCTWFVACGGGSSGGTGEPGGEISDAGDASTTHVTTGDDDGAVNVGSHDSGMTGTEDGGGSMPDAAALKTFTISGTVTGLAGDGLVLEDNGLDTVAVAAPDSDGGAAVPFSFAMAIPDGQMYTVAVKTNPNGPTQTCTVTSNSSATVSADVTDVGVTCVTNDYHLSVAVVGLLALDAGAGADAGDSGIADAGPDAGDAGDGGDAGAIPDDALVLTDSDGDQILVASDGTYTFPSQVPSGSMFDVEIARQPIFPQASCMIAGNMGTVMGGDIGSIAINCTPGMYTLSGTVGASLTGSGLVLDDGLGQQVTVNAGGVTGTFAFGTPLESGQTYNVTVATPPSVPTQTCTIANPHGTINAANVSNLGISCTTNKYNIGYTVSGLAGTGLVLTDTVGTASTPTDTTAAITGNVTANFATEVTSNVGYKVAIKTQPTNPSQTCTVNTVAGPVNGTVTNTDVNIAVACTTNTYAISGTVAGLTTGSGGTVTLTNGADTVTVTAPATGTAPVAFAFPTSVASGATYSLAISTQPNKEAAPVTEYCTFVNGSGTITTAAVSNLTVTCRAMESVAVLYSDSHSADVVATLTGTNAFTTVGSIDTSSAEPTLAQLEAYNAVLVYSGAPFLPNGPTDAATASDAGAARLGNLLDTYIRTLQTVAPFAGQPYRVVGMAELDTTANDVGGSFASKDFGLKVGSATSGPDGLNKTDITTTSLLSGVSSFTASVAIRGTSGLANGAAKVAEWGDTNPLVVNNSYTIVVGATTTTYYRADLNFYPVSSKVNDSYWKGDGAQLMVNALLYRSPTQ